MKENFHVCGLQQIVGGELERCCIVGLGQDLAAKSWVNSGQALETTKPRQQVIDNAVNDLTVLDTVNFRVQTAEIAQSRDRSGSAEEAVALDKQRGVSLAGGCHRCGNSSRPAAEHNDVIFAADRRFSPGLDDYTAYGSLPRTAAIIE